MIRLLTNAKFQYISIIKKHPHGVINRMQRFDEWANTWNDPNIKCYRDYFQNGQNPKFQSFIPDSPSSKYDVAQAASRYRPAIFDLHESFNLNENQFADDQFLSRDIKDLKLSIFLKQCLKKETRTDLHTFFMLMVSLGLLWSVALYRGVIKEDYHQQVVELQPDQTFYHYNPNALQYEVKQFINKINTINQHSNQILKAAKQRAEQRKIRKQ